MDGINKLLKRMRVCWFTSLLIRRKMINNKEGYRWEEEVEELGVELLRIPLT